MPTLNSLSLEWSNMFFSVSSDGFELSLDFEPDSVTLIAKEIVEKMTVKYQGNPLGASRCHKGKTYWTTTKREFHFPQPSRDFVYAGWRTFICRCKKDGYNRVSGVRSGGCWDSTKISQLDDDAVSRPGQETPFSKRAIDSLETGGSLENLFLWLGWQREFAIHHSNLWETQPTPALLRGQPIGIRNGNLLAFVYRLLFL